MQVDDLKSKATRAGDPKMAVMESPEPSAKAKAIGAAAGAGLLGIQLTGDLTTGAVLAIVCAYGTTLSNGFGSATKSLGSACAKVYDKTLDLQEEYELIQKAKSAIDTTVTVADNLNENYQITGKIDEKLKLGAAVDKARFGGETSFFGARVFWFGYRLLFSFYIYVEVHGKHKEGSNGGV